MTPTTGTPSTVWQQQMDNARIETQQFIHSGHPQLYQPNNYIKESETQFRPLQTVEDYTLSTITPSMETTRTGTTIFMISTLCNCDKMTILQRTMRTIPTLRTSNCLEPSLNFGSQIRKQLHKKYKNHTNKKTTNASLAFWTKRPSCTYKWKREGEPSYVPFNAPWTQI